MVGVARAWSHEARRSCTSRGLSPPVGRLRILEETRQPHTTVAEVLRRHGLDATTFYRWERVAKAGMREALAERPRKNGGVPGKGWFTILRLYGRLESWFDKSWKPGELDRVH